MAVSADSLLVHDEDAHADWVAHVRVHTSPVLDGILTCAAVGALLPGLPVLMTLVAVYEGGHEVIAFLLLPVLGAVFGAALGTVSGVLDAPGRLAVALARRDGPLALLLMSQLAGVIIGGPLIALTAGASGAVVVLFMAPFSGGGVDQLPGLLLMGGITGWFYGLLLGTPALILHATARGLGVANGSPRFVGPLVAATTAVGVQVWLIIAYLGLVGVGMIVALAAW